MPSARLTLQQRIAHLEQENQRLRTLLHQHGIPCDTPDAAPARELRHPRKRHA